MKNISLILLLGLWLLLAGGCAVSGASGRTTAFQTSPYSGMGVPPSFYNYDPALEYWFTPPYFNPYIGSR